MKRTEEANWYFLKQLKDSILSEVSPLGAVEPSTSEINAWILDAYKENPTYADVLASLLTVEKDMAVLESELPPIGDIQRKIKSVEDKPLPLKCFLSVVLNDNTRLGVLIQREPLMDGGFVYPITFFFGVASRGVIRLELRASQKNKEPFVSGLSQTGWITRSMQTFVDQPYAVLGVKCLLVYHEYLYPVISTESLKIEILTPTPRTSGRLDQLLTDAYKDRIRCTKAKVPIERIKPEDMDHALAYPSEKIQRSMSWVKDQGEASFDLLLYEQDGWLMMGDDYEPYLAYRALGISPVPAVILGKFTEEGVEVIERGYSELIPAIGIAVHPRRAKADQQKLLDQKLAKLAPKVGITEKLRSVFVDFCRLLADEGTREKELHRFLKAHPTLLDSHFASILSEVKIGQFRADLVLRYNQVDKAVLLVELERQSDKIFNKSDRLTFKVNHACQQVEDWIREIRNSAPRVPSWLQGAHLIEGVVVVGRANQLTEPQKAILVSNNANRAVKVLTYDDLLERLKQLILALDGIARG